LLALEFLIFVIGLDFIEEVFTPQGQLFEKAFFNGDKGRHCAIILDFLGQFIINGRLLGNYGTSFSPESF